MNMDWKFTGFYGHPDATKRLEAWNLLKRLEQLTPGPWACIGDFNEIVTLSEKSGGNMRQRSQMTAFQNTIEECDLTDLGFVGPKFTWSNCQEGHDTIRERLDRGVANREWRRAFPEAEVHVAVSACSDHAPLFLYLARPPITNGKNPRFYYEAGWANNESCKEVINSVWSKVYSNDLGWARLGAKLKECITSLKMWCRNSRKDGQQEFLKLNRRLLSLQEREDTAVIPEIKKIKTQLHVLLDNEELWWRQRAKEDWLKMGDRNTRFFHACASDKRRRNRVETIIDERGQRRESQAEIENAFVVYFSELFTRGPLGDIASCIQPIESRVSADMNANLLLDFSMEEIEAALFQMGPYKAPGPDGLNASFFQTNWSTMREEVCQAILEILNYGVIPQDLNLTHITLIPKLKNPLHVTDFRPISLCNVLYKLISKVLANRLKKILPSIIAPTQSAFIPGRLISDNVLAAYETLHTMHTGMKGKKGYMAVKLDMSKAYDRVEWGFLEAVMEQMGFNRRWIDLVMMCVRSVKYSIVVNGTPCGLITPSRGIRQGDPISPYLFLLCAESLSAMFSQANRDGRLTGVPTSRGGPVISHLFFADDSLLFCRSNMTQWNHLTAILHLYEGASGQKMNSNKTGIFFSKNSAASDKIQIQGVAGIPVDQRYDTYLGLPAIVGRSRIRAFRSIKDKVWKRLQDWKLTFLSQAGKEILLKAVVQAIPTYCMSVFKLPKTLCTEINSMMMRFFWGHKEKEKRIHWLSWSKLSTSKAQGGMGFRDIVNFNKALLAKQIWRLWKFPNSLIATIMKAKYYPNCSVLEADCGKKPSFAWRSIQSSSDLIKEGLVWRVGNGKSIRIWKDRWFKSPTTYKIISPPKILDPNSTVSALIEENTKWWNLGLLHQLFSSDEVKSIQALPISETNQEDCLVWRGTARGVFSVRSAYHIQKDRILATKAEGSSCGRNKTIWNKIWQLKIKNTEKHFLWRACHDSLPTKVNLASRMIISDPLCPICGLEPETAYHILWQCPSACDVWSAGGPIFQKSHFEGPKFLQVVEGMHERCDSEDFHLFAGISRRVWLRRNAFIHEGAFSHPNSIIEQARQELVLLKTLTEGETGNAPPVGDPPSTSWKAPPQGWLKANWDAGLDRKNGRVGLGVVIRDHLGKMWAAKSQTRHGFLDPSAAEAWAARMAVQLCIEMGTRQVQLEGDAMNVIAAINAEGGDTGEWGQITGDIHCLLRNFSQWEMKYTCRGNNKVAHALAHFAVTDVMDMVWFYTPPDCIRDLLQAEYSALQISHQ
jgi:hypothetical protein